MQYVGPSIFFRYFGRGFLIVAFLGAALGFFGPQYRYPTPEYRAYRTARAAREAWEGRFATWRREQQERQQGRAFESAIAGFGSVDNVADTELRELAQALRPLAANALATPQARATALTTLLRLRSGSASWSRWMSCDSDAHERFTGPCHFLPPLTIFEYPGDLERLLAGDARGLMNIRPMPEEFRRRPPLPAQAPPIMTRSLWVMLALFLWSAFAIGFYTQGMNRYRDLDENGDNKFPHPLDLAPNFPLGWVLMLAILPSLLLLHAWRFLFADVNTALKERRARAANQSFKTEYDEFRTQLEGFKKRASGLGDKALCDRIDEILGRVTSAGNSEQLLQLRVALTELELQFKSTEEVNHTLSDR